MYNSGLWKKGFLVSKTWLIKEKSNHILRKAVQIIGTFNWDWGWECTRNQFPLIMRCGLVVSISLSSSPHWWRGRPSSQCVFLAFCLGINKRGVAKLFGGSQAQGDLIHITDALLPASFSPHSLHTVAINTALRGPRQVWTPPRATSYVIPIPQGQVRAQPRSTEHHGKS